MNTNNDGTLKDVGIVNTNNDGTPNNTAKVNTNSDGIPKNTGEIEKSKSYVIFEIIEYVPDAVLSKTILKKLTGNITAVSFAMGEELAEKTSPYDTFIQIIDGKAEITINKKIFLLSLGQGIIIPAHATHYFNAHEKFKMISTVIKSGYED